MELWKILLLVFVGMFLAFGIFTYEQILHAKDQLKNYKTVESYCGAIYGGSKDTTDRDVNQWYIDANDAYRELQKYARED